ncbi:Mu transposase domain-containing protein [sulfur-oxidizing endosymbiont of Gigantopelta aegis]|uniref:Mu transposase domain-containing protein n=1 Tax=sulfur-oxidizing endosymbiont of Gigantopelta aegis TaxID=2794934 RepID=UPI0018DB1BA3|nr:hypothetical protein [sulfur-oxidizing endosymbiont of Gigantopelta aegis]
MALVIYVKVTTRSTISVKRVTYTVPSRLIGTTLLIHIYDQHLDCFYGHELTLSLKRIYAHRHIRSRSINYKHIIHSLAKSPMPLNHRLTEMILPFLLKELRLTTMVKQWQQVSQKPLN